MLGYDVYEDKRSFEKEGLTGNVKKYTTEKMSFPCFVIVSDEEHKVPLFKIKTIKQMSSTVDIYNEEEAKMAMDIYFTDNVKVVSICKIYPRQVKSFLKLFNDNKIDGYYDKDTKLEGDMLYILSN